MKSIAICKCLHGRHPWLEQSQAEPELVNPTLKDSVGFHRSQLELKTIHRNRGYEIVFMESEFELKTTTF